MSSDTLLREVDEELRRDRVRKLWRQAGPWVIGGAVAVVLVVAGYEGWTWWQKSQSAKSSDQFYSATELADGTDLEGARKALDEVIAGTSGGYPDLARFREAALLAQQGKTDEAVAAYDGLSTSLTNPHFRELALVLAGMLLIDKGDVSAVQQRVGGSLTAQSPMRNAAREVMGLVQYKAGKLQDAMQSFQAIVDDPLTAQDVRQRIQLYQIQLVAEGAQPIVSSSEAAPDVSASAPADASSVAVSSEASAALDASTELDVTPPVDASAASSAAVSSATSSAEVSSVESSSAPSSAMEISSSAP
jgi:hypothetical protein